MAELKFVMTNIGNKLSEKEAQDLMSHFDVDQDGCIQYEGLKFKNTDIGLFRNQVSTC